MITRPKNIDHMRYRLTVILFILFSALLCVNAGFADTVKNYTPKIKWIKKSTESVYRDSSAIQTRSFNADSLKHYKADKEFNYKEQGIDVDPSFLERIWIWIMRHLFGWTRNARYDGTWMSIFLIILKYLFYALLVALLVFVVIKAIGIDLTQLFGKRSKKIDLDYSESTEDIDRIDFDGELERALAQNNYRLSVRLLYLRCLKQLSDAQLIHWQIDKTNSAYVSELTDPDQRQSFKAITRQFEYVWYGNFAIDKQSFSSIALLFQNFKQLLP
jgi:hypothetical protein